MTDTEDTKNKKGRTHHAAVWKQRSTGFIKNAMLGLIAEKDFSQIRLEELVSRANVSKKTFYKYYGSKYEVLDGIEEDLLSESEKPLKTLQPQDLRGGVMVLYHLLDTDDKAYHKLFTEDEYVDFFHKFKIDYFSLEFFRTFYKGIDCQAIMPGYLSSAAGIFREWKEGRGGTDIRTVDELADYAAHLLLMGLGGIE